MGVRVVHGIHDRTFSVEGKTVAAVRRGLRDVFNIPAEAEALIDGRPVPEERVLIDGETVEFLQDVGEKGLGALLTPEELRDRWRLSQCEYEELLVLGLPTIPFASGTIRHPEAALDEFFRGQGDKNRQKPSQLVGTPYVAERLGCTSVWVTQLIRRGEIPPSCVAAGTGNGKKWMLYRTRIDEWLARR